MTHFYACQFMASIYPTAFPFSACSDQMQLTAASGHCEQLYAPSSLPTDLFLQVTFIQTAYGPCPDMHILTDPLINKAQGPPQGPTWALCSSGCRTQQPSGVGAPCNTAPTDLHWSLCQTGRSKTNGEFLIWALQFRTQLFWKSLRRSVRADVCLQVAEAAWCAVVVSSLWIADLLCSARTKHK